MKKIRNLMLLILFSVAILYPMSADAATLVEREEIKTDGQWNAYTLEEDVNHRYPIYIKEAGELKITFQSMSPFHYMAFYDEDLVRIEYFDISGSDSSPKTVEKIKDVLPGTYYVQAEEWNGVGTYRIKAEFTPANNNEVEPNNTYVQAQNIEIGQEVVGFLTSKMGQSQKIDEDDFYTFDVKKKGKVKITYAPDKKGGRCLLYDEDLVKKAESDTYGNDPYIWEKELEAGVYYICIERWNEGGRYTLKAEQEIPVTKVKLNGVTKIVKGNTAKVGNVISPLAATFTDLKWTTSNSKVIKIVNQNGKIKAVNYGQATITATAHNGVKGKITIKVVPKKMTLSKVVKGKKKATLTWKKISDVTGYQVYAATKKDGKYTKVATVKTATKFKNIEVKNLKSKKTYYFKVRAYKKVGDKTYYGAYSNIKSVKIK